MMNRTQENFNRDLLDFIAGSPVSFHAAANAEALLEAAGFCRLAEDKRWEIRQGGRYYVTRNDSALLAFEIPQTFEGIRISASHCDSPYFKIKDNPEISREGYVVLNVERYGGVILAPWFDRPLGVAGRLCVKAEDGSIQSRLVDFEKDMLIIPSLAIHMDRSVNEGVKWNVQDHMLPLYALASESGSCGDLAAGAAALAGAGAEDVLGYDLYVYNRQRGCIWGPEEEFLSAPRLDDLQCAFACLRGFLAGGRQEHLCIYALLDNEEVGSFTRQGAASTFLKDTLKRLYLALGRDFEQYQVDLAKGFMLSTDNAHAVHPNFAGKADPVNRPVIGKGVVLKFAASQKYCTDAYSAALFRQLSSEAGCPVQVYTNRSDMAGGSTLGNLSNNQVSIPTADIGLPQLAMHSPFETAGTRDGENLAAVMTRFFA